jgi:anti-sigma B factor antagonist
MELACSIEVVQRGDAIILIVEGEVDLTSSSMLEERLREAEAADAPLVIVDLDRVSFMDLSGLHVLVSHVGRVGSGDRLRLTHGSRQVRRLLEITGMQDRLPFVSSERWFASPPQG